MKDGVRPCGNGSRDHLGAGADTSPSLKTIPEDSRAPAHAGFLLLAEG